jgi:SPP1 gp7 family putative phage head morphogenesis protein
MIEQIMSTGQVVRSRATTIARTETARVSSTLTKIRAQHIGSPGYIWRTVHDQRVRDTHRKMDGVFVYWDKPVVVDVGVPPYHAGCIWNCRCFADPVIPDQYRV